jgi:urease accessory protein
MSRARAALLLLADGRLPAGGYAHSGGLEESIRAGRVGDLAELAGFLRGRAATAGMVSAAFAAAGCHAFATGATDRFDVLDVELDARMPSPTMRDVSRTLGRQMRRAVARMRPDAGMDRLGRAPHQPVVLGAAAALLGAVPHDAASAALHEAVTGPGTAAVRLLPIDPFDVHAVLAGLTELLDELAATAAGYAAADPHDLPATASPLLDIAAEHHRRVEVRLFAS